MKKLLYLLLLIPAAFIFSSCSDDDKLPNVDITMTFDNAVVDNGTLYVMQDSVFSMTSLSTKAVGNDKQTAIVNVKYFWNGIPAPGLTWSAFPLQINMAQFPTVKSGANVLGLRATLLEVDKSIAYCDLNVPIKAVETEADFPDGQTPGEVSLTFTTAQSTK